MKRAILITAVILAFVVFYTAGRTRLADALFSPQDWKYNSAAEALRTMSRENAMESLWYTAETLKCEAEGAYRLARVSKGPVRPSRERCGGISMVPYADPTAIFPVWLATIDPKLDGPRARRIRAELTDAVCAPYADCAEPSRLATHYADAVTATADKVVRLRNMVERAPRWRSRATLEYGLLALDFRPSDHIFEMFFRSVSPESISKAPALPSEESEVLRRPQASVDFPAVVMILRETGLDARGLNGVSRDLGPYCTGTLINASVILTAAHCICGADRSSESCLTNGKPAKDDIRFSGDSYRVLFQGVGIRQVSSLIVHPDYVSIKQDHTNNTRVPHADIALMVLASPMLEVKPAHLAEGKAAISKQRGMFVGFGLHRRLVDDGRGDLRYADEVTMSPGAKIQDVFALSDCPDGTALFCASNAGVPRGGRPIHGAVTGFCSGDSGGPFIPVPEDGGKWLKSIDTSASDSEKFSIANKQLVVEALAAGTHSYGICDARDQLTLTDVRPLVPWIRRTLGSLGMAGMTPGPLALEPLINNVSGPRFLISQSTGARNGLDPLNLEQRIDLGEIPSNTRRITITINTTCTSQSKDKCSGSSLSLALVDPSGREVDSCNVKPLLTTVIGCEVPRQSGGWAPGFWHLRVLGYQTPRDPVHALRPLQDLQVAAVAF